ncbi:hypothetical protein IWZ00DRAFT_493289 [Phyllosticta capitalensis]
MDSTPSTSDTPGGERSTGSIIPPKLLRPAQTSLFLDPARIPREIRDLVYEEIIKDYFRQGRDVTSGCSHLHGLTRSCTSSPKKSSFRLIVLTKNTFPTDRLALPQKRGILPPLAATCKQVQDEMLERIHSICKFHFLATSRSERVDYFSPVPFVDISNIHHLEFSFRVFPTTSHAFKPGKNSFLGEAPYSVRYSPSGLLSNAKLVRSDEDSFPTPYFNLNKYGFFSDEQLPSLLGAKRIGVLPMVHNSHFARCLDKFMSILGSHGKYQSLSVHVQVKRGIAHAESGAVDFVRPFFAHQSKTQTKTTRFYLHDENSKADASWSNHPTLGPLAREIQRNLGLQQSHFGSYDVVCRCTKCFPSLGKGKARCSGAETSVSGSGAQEDVQERIDAIELEKQRFLAAEEFSEDEDIEDIVEALFPAAFGFFSDFRDEWAEGHMGFQVGHSDDDFLADIQRLWVEDEEWDW